jgi:cytochrome c553
MLCVVAAPSVFTLDAQSSPPTNTFDVPRWAFPGISPDAVAPKPPYDTVEKLHIPRSTRSFTLAQTKDQLVPPDWFPASHPPAPQTVVHARPAMKFACGYCHLPDGHGRSENATIVGLPPAYFIEQVVDFRSGARRAAVDGWGPSQRMHEVVQEFSDAEAAEVARYFAGLHLRRRYKVVERTMIPRVYEANGLYAARSRVPTDSLGRRMIEITNDIERHELRDPNETFTTFVPPGSVARGRRIAASAPTGSATRCATCHGATLRGLTTAPPLAGRSPAYMLRQLIGFRTGARAGTGSTAMRQIASQLGLDDMIAVAAYAGSLRP